MVHSMSIEITPINDQIPLLLQTEKDEVEEGRKIYHLIEIKETNGQDSLGWQKNKSVKQNFDEKFENLDNSSIESTTIFKVTVGLKESNPDAYKPKLISIGPYHKRNPELHSMEKYKLRYLQRFLRRKGGINVESCMSKMEELRDVALKCYDDIKDLGSDILENFSEMLLLDGCFVVEYIRDSCGMRLDEGEEIIIKEDCIYNQVHRDLLLVENQLPFCVLTALYDMTSEYEISLTKLVMYFFLAKLWRNTPLTIEEREYNEEDIKHLLQVVHMTYSDMKTSLISNSTRGAEYSSLQTRYKVMPNATELSEAGINFEKVGEIDDISYTRDYFWDGIALFDIKFESGVMKIPCFEVVDDTETFLRNLIAYEQHSSEVCPKYFTDFAIFMDYLIDSDKDVSLLRQMGIINNKMGEDKEVASLFNNIGKWVAVSQDDFYYSVECQKAIQHCERPCNKRKASLRHNYFNSPWAGISTVAAIILLLLTVIQTVLSFISTFKN